MSLLQYTLVTPRGSTYPLTADQTNNMSSTNQPPEKKQKTDDTSWRSKCIERFGLKPVPDGSGLAGSEDAWRKYYQIRVKIEEDDDARTFNYSGYNSDGSSILNEDDNELKEQVISR